MDYEKQFAAFFNACADAAGEIALKYFRGYLPVDEKQDRSPVTQADKEIEQKLRAMIGQHFPAHGIIGEEYGRDRPDAEFVWVIDPIDGTRAFMTGKPLFGTIIGLIHNGMPAVGLIDQAYTKERWFGITNQMATHNGKPIKIAPPRKLDNARLFIGPMGMFEGKNFEKYIKLCNAVRWQQYGCDCYAYGLLAMGWADLVVEQNLGLHDAVGVAPIVTGAGGYISDWKGNQITSNFSDQMIAASTKALAMEALEILA
ncbi:MAG: inositol monophosphatase family protein [Alphaproteobacteria bacterium]|nr:inositol monophosphatase family protein [Alphaproteobacteria bacterium]